MPKSNVLHIFRDLHEKVIPTTDEDIIPNNAVDFLSKKLGEEQHLSDVIKLLIKYLTKKSSIDKSLLDRLEAEYIPARLMASLYHEFPEKHSHFIVPLRIYIKDDNPEAFAAIESAALKIAELEEIYFGFSSEHLKGSIFKNAIGIFNLFGQNKKLDDRVKDIDTAIDSRLLDLPRAQIDDQLSSAVSRLITALSSIDESVVNLGSLILIKTNDLGGSRIVAFDLTREQFNTIQKNPSLLKNPSSLLNLLQCEPLKEKLTVDDSKFIQTERK